MLYELTIYENGYTRIERYKDIETFWLDSYGAFDATTYDGKRILTYGVQSVHGRGIKEDYLEKK